MSAGGRPARPIDWSAWYGRGRWLPAAVEPGWAVALWRRVHRLMTWR